MISGLILKIQRRQGCSRGVVHYNIMYYIVFPVAFIRRLWVRCSGFKGRVFFYTLIISDGAEHGAFTTHRKERLIMQKAYLILETGRVFEGESFGAAKDSMGELVFTTGMTGLAESLTDPSYYGQIVIYTFPELGNYGICLEDTESDECRFRGVVARSFTDCPSNFRSKFSVDEYLKRHNIPGICGIDTRELTQLIRERGVVNAMITTHRPDAVPDALHSYRVEKSVESTSTPKPFVMPAEGDALYNVALLDYGAKISIAKSLIKRGCTVTVLPYNTPAEEILSGGYDGVMLSNGPGDPADNVYPIQQIKKLLGRIPMFGICLGHQMLAVAAGGKTRKMKFGHRGANQPVKDLETGRIYITSQNHGYAVDADSLSATEGALRYVNVNDGSCEGVDYPKLRAFSMQFHPEAHAGPMDCEAGFDRFITMMGGK